jgi:hypothetical protein
VRRLTLFICDSVAYYWREIRQFSPRCDSSCNCVSTNECIETYLKTEVKRKGIKFG